MTVFWGIDCGSTEIKVVACDSKGRVLHRWKTRTLFPLLDHVRSALEAPGFDCPLEGNAVRPGHRIAATGYGRAHIPFVQDKLTEIRAHFLGVEQALASEIKPEVPYTLIDIGGQDSKVISVKAREIQQFVINRKCAAGTGAYIEELAHRLELKLEQLSELEEKHDRELTLNSYCTVFAGQEVIKILMNGEKVENLIHALYQSVVKRVLEMTIIGTDTVVFSGGVLSHHPALRRIFAERLPGKRFLLAPDAQYCGALGAAMHGMQGS